MKKCTGKSASQSPRRAHWIKRALSSELDKLFISQHIRHAIKDKQRELEAIKEDVEEVKEYLTEGQQNRLAEIDREWNDFELE